MVKRALAATILAAYLPVATTGCFGTFQLTRKVYQFNRQVSPDKWIQEIAFLVLVILPIYGFATLLDAVIFNSVEFWTGNNPVLNADGATQTIETADGTATLTRIRADVLDVRAESRTGETVHFQLVREAGGFVARTPSGETLARVGERSNPFALGAARS